MSPSVQFWCAVERRLARGRSGHRVDRLPTGRAVCFLFVPIGRIGAGDRVPVPPGGCCRGSSGINATRSERGVGKFGHLPDLKLRLSDSAASNDYALRDSAPCASARAQAMVGRRRPSSPYTWSGDCLVTEAGVISAHPVFAHLPEICAQLDQHFLERAIHQRLNFALAATPVHDRCGAPIDFFLRTFAVTKGDDHCSIH